MLIFKCGLVILSSTYILSVCYQVTKEINSLDTGLAFFLVVSGAVGLYRTDALLWMIRIVIACHLTYAHCATGKIIYDRYQQIHILGSLTPNPHVTSFANRIASASASLFSLGFLVYFFLFLFKVESQCITALNIFICGFGTLYIWMQCILTTYISTLFYDSSLTVFRQCLANVSFPTVILMAIFGTAASLLPRGGSSGIYFCFIVTSLCTNILAAIFCVFILSFEKEYEYFAEGLRSELLLDDDCSLNNESLADVESLFNQDLPSSALVIKGRVTCSKMS